ncbi:MAG TPA: hypothetical protein VGC66_03060 [Pyrinomonadaceae bacterium]|jgi:hypothetical protein
MRVRYFVISLIICVSFITQAFAQTPPWTKFSSPVGGFSVLIPERPLQDDQSKDTRVGKVVMHFFTARSQGGVFIVAYADYAIGEVKRELDANRDSFLKGMKATLVSESDIKLQENPGREIKAVRDELSIRSRIFLVGKRYYQLVTITPATLAGNVEADKFLTSFELLTATDAAAR